MNEKRKNGKERKKMASSQPFLQKKLNSLHISNKLFIVTSDSI